MTDLPRYAVFIRNKKTDETFTFSSSWETLSAAQEQRDFLNTMTANVEAVIITSFYPGDVIDPGHEEDFEDDLKVENADLRMR